MTRERTWSLTRRMAMTFAVTTSAIVALYGLWSGYLFFDNVRDQTNQFMRHELGELGLRISKGDHSRENLLECARFVLEVEEHPVIALRIRDRKGKLLFEGGSRRLLRTVTAPLDDDNPPTSWFFRRRLAGHYHELDDPPLVLEILVDTKNALHDLGEYAQAVGVTFLFSVMLAAFAGWYASHRGLAALRAVTSQAHNIASPPEEIRIRADGAPEEVREVAEALEAMLRRIRFGISDMRVFTAGLAHELRSPLMNLIGSTEVALLKPRAPEEYVALLRDHLEDLGDLSEAVDNLVTFCRAADPDRSDLRSERFDLAEEAEIRLGPLRRQAERAGVHIAMRRSGDTSLNGDREDCLRVVKNLVGNAVSLAPAGTTITVRIEGGDGSVKVVVEDEGPGVPEELGDRIYEPFVSGRPREGRRAGYGLGLTICRHIIEAHGGTLHHENRPEGGARFVATFPISTRRGRKA